MKCQQSQLIQGMPGDCHIENTLDDCALIPDPSVKCTGVKGCNYCGSGYKKCTTTEYHYCVAHDTGELLPYPNMSDPGMHLLRVITHVGRVHGISSYRSMVCASYYSESKSCSCSKGRFARDVWQVEIIYQYIA